MAEILTPEQILVLADQIKELLAKDSQGVGEVPVVASLDNILSLPALQVIGSDEKVVEAPLSLLRVSLRKAATAIEWRQGDTGMWQTLVSIPDITGPKGKTPVFRTGTNGIEWKYESEEDGTYRILVPYDVLKLKFSDLTAEQIQLLKLKYADLTEEEILGLKRPATDAADEIRKEMSHITTAVNTAISNTEEARGRANTAAKLADEVRIETNKVRIETDKVQEAVVILKGETEQVKKDTEQVKIDTDKVRMDTIKEKNNAISATKNADESSRKASDAADRLNDLSDHRDEIRNGYWWRWDEKTGEYEETGEIAKGNMMYATFDFDPVTGELAMYTDEEYAGPTFELDNKGELSVII